MLDTWTHFDWRARQNESESKKSESNSYIFLVRCLIRAWVRSKLRRLQFKLEHIKTPDAPPSPPPVTTHNRDWRRFKVLPVSTFVWLSFPFHFRFRIVSTVWMCVRYRAPKFKPEVRSGWTASTCKSETGSEPYIKRWSKNHWIHSLDVNLIQINAIDWIEKSKRGGAWKKKKEGRERNGTSQAAAKDCNNPVKQS